MSEARAGHSFADIEPALAGAASTPGLALTATIVVVGPAERMAPAADALRQLTDVGVRAILISNGAQPTPTIEVTENTVVLDGLKPDYLNNAVAALRLSSLPTLVWWRGGSPDVLDGLADLADRLVLDADDPSPIWPRVAALVERTAVSDLRWTRLTRWRALMAHFFDIPEVRAAAAGFHRLQIDGADVHAARLFAGWLSASLRWKNNVTVSFRETPGPASIERVELGDGAQDLTLKLAPSATCVETTARVEGHAGAARIVSLGDQRLAALIGEELRIRSRDLAFERALSASEGIL